MPVCLRRARKRSKIDSATTYHCLNQRGIRLSELINNDGQLSRTWITDTLTLRLRLSYFTASANKVQHTSAMRNAQAFWKHRQTN